MEAWIIYFRDSATYNRQYIQFYIEEGLKLGINVKLILVEDLEFGVRDGQWFLRYRHMEIERPEFAICRAIHPLLSRQLELMGIRVFNNSKVSEICNDKARTYQYLAGTGIRMVDSSFYRNSQLKEELEKIYRPTVIKAVEGHGGSQVFLAEPNRKPEEAPEPMKSAKEVNRADLTALLPSVTPLSQANQEEADTKKTDILNGIGSSDVVIQPFTGNRNQDLRVYIIGTEIIAAVLRTAKEGFKSNFSLGGEVELYQLKEEERKIVKQIINQFDFGLVGIDFIIGDEGEMIFNEIEDVVGSRMLYQCSDINIVELYLKHILSVLNRLSGRSISVF